MKVKSEREVAQSCPTLSNPMDCSLPGSSVHGIFQARVLEWGAIAFSVIHCYESLNRKLTLEVVEKMKVLTPFDSAVTVLGTDPRETGHSTGIFIAAWYRAGNKCPSVPEQTTLWVCSHNRTLQDNGDE